MNAQSRTIETGLIKKAQKSVQQLQTNQENVNPFIQKGQDALKVIKVKELQQYKQQKEEGNHNNNLEHNKYYRVQPSTNLSTSSILRRTPPRTQRPRSESIRSAAEIAHDATERITNKVEKNMKTFENQLLHAQSQAIETRLIKKAQKTAQQLQKNQENIN